MTAEDATAILLEALAHAFEGDARYFRERAEVLARCLEAGVTPDLERIVNHLILIEEAA